MNELKMQPLVKGSHAPREIVKCQKCGADFERAVVHPYIVDCPACRGKIKAVDQDDREFKKRVSCKYCRVLLQSEQTVLGMKRCPLCKEMWWCIPAGSPMRDGRVVKFTIWKNWLNDEVFTNGKYLGTNREQRLVEILTTGGDL